MVKKYTFKQIFAAAALFVAGTVAASAADYAIQPKSDIIEEFTAMTVTFSGATEVTEAGYNTTVKVNGDNARCTTSVEGNVYTVSATQAVTKDGAQVEVTIPAGTISVDGTVYDQVISMQYKVSNDGDFTVSAVPANYSNVLGLNTITITFDGAESCAYTASSAETSAELLKMDSPTGTHVEYYFANNLSVSGNTMTLTVGQTETPLEGWYKVVFPAGSYTVNGNAGDPFELLYMVKKVTYSVNPKTPIVESLDRISFTFTDFSAITENAATPITITKGEDVVRSFSEIEGNVLTIGAVHPEELTNGIYQFNVPAGAINLDGMTWNGEIRYQVTLDIPAPEFTDAVTPAEGTVATLKDFTVAFGGENVEATLSTEQSSDILPYILDAAGNRIRTAGIDFSIADNVLSFGFSQAVTDAGDYKVVVPGSLYFINGVQGVDLTYSYSIKAAPKFGFYPLQNELTEPIEAFEIRFAEGTTLEEVAYNAGITDAATGEIVRSHTSVDGNAYKIAVIGNLMSGHSYTVTVPAGTLKVNGELLQVEISKTYLYTPDIDESFTTVPAAGDVESLQTITITYTNATTVAVTANSTETAAKFTCGEESVTVSPATGTITAEGNVITIILNEAINKTGNWCLTIPAAAITVDGAAAMTDVVVYYNVAGKEDGIADITVSGADNAIYTITGVKVSSKPARGLYIVNGVKTVIR